MNGLKVGKRLREIRKSISMKQSTLARLSGVDRIMISRYECGHVIPCISTLCAMTEAMDIGLGEFFERI